MCPKGFLACATLQQEAGQRDSTKLPDNLKCLHKESLKILP